MAVTVITMGVHYRWELPEVVRVQLELAHQLREDLVTAQLETDAAISAVWSKFPQVAEIEEAAAAAQQDVNAATAAVQKERATTRARVTGPPAEQLKEAKARLAQCRRARREQIAQVRPLVRAQIRDIHDELYARYKQLYKLYCSDGNLDWSTFNEVLAQHKTAVKRVASVRQQGRPANLRHHRFDGTGTITVQLQRETGGPQRTPELIANPTGKYRNVVVVPWIDPDQWAAMSRAEQRQAGRVTVRMRCGSLHGQRQWIDIPVQQHRMLPADADILMARLSVTRTSDQYRAQVLVTARHDTPTTASRGPDVAVRLGWREDDAGIIVANWRATAPLEVPDRLHDLLIADPGGTTGLICLPRSVIDQVEYADQLGAQRSTAFATIRGEVVTWLTDHGPIPHPTGDGQLTAADVARWRSPGQLARLETFWQDSPPAEPEIVAAVARWRREDVPVWRRQEHSRAKALRRRRDYYRQVAAHLAQVAGRVVVDDMALTTIASAGGQNSDLREQVRRQIARRRVVAAPGSLRAVVTAAAERDGVEVVTVSTTNLLTTHPRCGHITTSPKIVDGQAVCEGCGDRYNPHLAATLTMLSRASAQGRSQ